MDGEQTDPRPSAPGVAGTLRAHGIDPGGLVDRLPDLQMVYAPVRDADGEIVDLVVVGADPVSQAVLGAPFGGLVGVTGRQMMLSEGAASLLVDLVEVARTGTPLVRDAVRLVNPSAGVAWHDIRALRIEDLVWVTWRDATTRQDAIERLASSEQRFRLLAENASDIVVHSRDNVVLWASPAIADRLGWAPEQVVGRAFSEFAHPDEVELIHGFARELEEGRVAVRRLRAATADGRWRWFEARGEPYELPDGTIDGEVITFRAIDAEVVAERALRDSEARYRLLVEHSTDVVYEVDDGVVTWITPSVRDALGFEPAEMIGRLGQDLVHPDHLLELRDADEALAATGFIPAVPVRFHTQGGGHRWMSLRGSLLSPPGEDPVRLVVSLRDITDERAAQDELAYRAFHDPLTGLHNRAWILDLLDSDLRAARRRGVRLGMLFIDLDNFKVVNDSLGHGTGDTVLSTVAARILSALRGDDRVGRFGGDEFVVVVPEVGGVHELELIAQRLSDAVAQEIVLGDHRIVPTASIGIAISTESSSSQTMLRETDLALFRAKDTGRARWHFFDDEMHDQAVRRLTVEGELRLGLERREFVPYYQPIVRLADGAVVGYEALVRWNHPTRGVLAPGEFLGVAEESGLIVGIGHQVLDQVCQRLADRPDLPGAVSVNFSPRQLQRPDWREEFVARVEQHGVDPARLVVEITETGVLSMLDTTADDLVQVRALGVGVHVDDFGTGFSSISLLRDLPVSGIKLDRSFTSRLLDDDPTTSVIATGIATLATGLHLDSIAEGVETAEQALALLGQGWVHGQGWLYGRPEPEPALRSLRQP